MESKMKVKVVMLESTPLPNGKQIYQNRYGDKLFIPITGASARRNYKAGAKPKELYFTSNEEIQVGDWYIAERNTGKKLSKCCNKHDGMIISEHGYYPYNIEECKKVVATTDISLNLPFIPQSFVEKYVELNGNIDEVMVETGISGFTDGWIPSYNNPDNNELDEPAEPIVNVKTRKDNTVIVSKVKDTWNYDEHCTDMQYYMEHCQSNGYVTPQKWLADYKNY